MFWCIADEAVRAFTSQAYFYISQGPDFPTIRQNAIDRITGRLLDYFKFAQLDDTIRQRMEDDLRLDIVTPAVDLKVIFMTDSRRYSIMPIEKFDVIDAIRRSPDEATLIKQIGRFRLRNCQKDGFPFRYRPKELQSVFGLQREPTFYDIRTVRVISHIYPPLCFEQEMNQRAKVDPESLDVVDRHAWEYNTLVQQEVLVSWLPMGKEAVKDEDTEFWALLVEHIPVSIW